MLAEYVSTHSLYMSHMYICRKCESRVITKYVRSKSWTDIFKPVTIALLGSIELVDSKCLDGI